MLNLPALAVTPQFGILKKFPVSCRLEGVRMGTNRFGFKPDGGLIEWALHPDPSTEGSQERRRKFKNLNKNVFGLGTHPVAKLELRVKLSPAIRSGHQDPADIFWKSQLLAALGAGSDCIVCHLSVISRSFPFIFFRCPAL